MQVSSLSLSSLAYLRANERESYARELTAHSVLLIAASSQALDNGRTSLCGDETSGPKSYHALPSARRGCEPKLSLLSSSLHPGPAEPDPLSLSWPRTLPTAASKLLDVHGLEM